MMRLLEEKKILKLFLSVLFLVCCFSSINVYADENEGGIDVILMIDTSGSMKDNDPNKEALSLADFFVKQLPDNDLRVGVYSFTTEVNTVFPFGEVSGIRQDKTDIISKLNELDKIDYTGDTDIGLALGECANIWESEMKDVSDSRKQLIIFLSDGDIDFEESVDDWKLKECESHAKMMKVLGNEDYKCSDGECQCVEKCDCVKVASKLPVIDFEKCPIYVIAFSEALEGEDALTIANTDGNYLIPAKEIDLMQNAFDKIFENMLGTKAISHEDVVINEGDNTIPLRNDFLQVGLNLLMAPDSDGAGSAVKDMLIKLQNDLTGETYSLEDLHVEDYYNKKFGRLLKFTEDILKQGPLSLVIDSEKNEVIDIKEYWIYKMKIEWESKIKRSYDINDSIEINAKILGIDISDLEVYAIYEKIDDEKNQNIIPDQVISGKLVEGVDMYESSLYGDENELYSGIKLELDENNNLSSSVSFETPGNYQLFLYGENGRVFTTSERMTFRVEDKSFKSLCLDILRIIKEVCIALIDFVKNIIGVGLNAAWIGLADAIVVIFNNYGIVKMVTGIVAIPVLMIIIINIIKVLRYLFS